MNPRPRRHPGFFPILALVLGLDARAQVRTTEALLPRETARAVDRRMPLSRIDAILSAVPATKRYEFALEGVRYRLRRWDMLHSGFAIALPGGSDRPFSHGEIRSIPFFVVATTSGRVLGVGTRREVLDSCPADKRRILDTLFRRVVARDTSEFTHLGVDSSLVFLRSHLNQWPPRMGDDPESRQIPAVLDRTESALASLAAASPRKARPRRLLGDLYRMRANLETSAARAANLKATAESHLKAALSLDSLDFESCYLLGTLYMGPDDSSARKAEPWFQRVRDRAPGKLRQQALWGLSLCAWIEGRRPQALEFANQYLKIEPGSKNTLYLKNLLEKDLARQPRPSP